MPVRGPRASLICSALLGALMISCGVPLEPEVASAPDAAPPLAAAPAPAVEAPPAPQVAPAPQAPPAPAPVAPPAPARVPVSEAPPPPKRPGGAPPGTELVAIPGKDPGDITLAGWKDLMNDACDDADYGPGCLNFHVNYKTKKGSDEECSVYDVKPDIGTKVTTKTRVNLTVRCDVYEEETSQENTDTTEEEGEKEDQNNNHPRDKKKDERGG